MSLIKVAWYVLRVKNMHPWSPSDPSGTADAQAKPRCVYSILKQHGQSSRYQVRLLPPRRSRGAYTQIYNHLVRVSSPPQSRSKAVVCVSTPRKYPRSGCSLVLPKIFSTLNTRHSTSRENFMFMFEHMQFKFFSLIQRKCFLAKITIVMFRM